MLIVCSVGNCAEIVIEILVMIRWSASPGDRKSVEEEEEEEEEEKGGAFLS